MPDRSLWSDRSLRAGALCGAGIAAFLDEAVLRRVPHRHRLPDGSGLSLGLVSDGLLHSFGWVATVIGLVMVADAVRLRALHRRVLAGGTLLGAGVFQLCDGTVQHGLLRLDQIRHHAGLVPHDRMRTVLAVLMILAGATLLVPLARRRAGAG